MIQKIACSDLGSVIEEPMDEDARQNPLPSTSASSGNKAECNEGLETAFLMCRLLLKAG